MEGQQDLDDEQENDDQQQVALLDENNVDDGEQDAPYGGMEGED